MNSKNLLLAAEAAATVLLLTAPAAAQTATCALMSAARTEMDHRAREARLRLERLEMMFIDYLTRDAGRGRH